MFRKIILALVVVSSFCVMPVSAEPGGKDHSKSSLFVEVFDTKKQEIIQQFPVDSYIYKEVKNILSKVELYGKFKLDFDGVLVKIPLSPAIKVDTDFLSGTINEVVLYNGRNANDENNFQQLAILITTSNQTIICVSSYNFDGFLKRILH